ncbi:hypothetical protein [Teredinibacter turnerae]|uniref:hypothetical protein n=1 Tax=Teredinibacter turnerae TaxID=2426 RepID=UPI00037FD59D|nr:hypothetical protein [Teredinibacter turnerae]
MNSKALTRKLLPRCVFIVVCLATITCVISCTKQAPAKSEAVNQTYSVAVENYKNKGLEIIYPADWSLLHDEAGIIADRTVAFETKEASRITVFIYKSQARTYSDLADNLEQQLRLRSSNDVKGFKREPVELGNYKGIRLGWINFGLSETKNEATILQLRAAPYPVFVQFHLFDDDIEYQTNTNLVPFLHGMSFDPQGVNL